MIYDTLTTQPKYVSHQLTLNSPTHNYHNTANVATNTRASAIASYFRLAPATHRLIPSSYNALWRHPLHR